MFGSKDHANGWCKCCDGKDEKCRCPHHYCWILVKIVVALVVLVFVFAAGVWVGKFSAYWHTYRDGYRMQGYPMMQQYPGYPVR